VRLTGYFFYKTKQIAEFAASVNLFSNAKEMKKHEEPLGSLEHLVLLAVMRLADDAYGVTVRKEIDSTTGRELSIGAIYSTLVRLEAKGFVKSLTGEPTAERGGRAKRYYRVTASGKTALHNTQETIQKMSAGIKGLGAT
jgi:PadR family transcriptional regulator